MAFSRNRLNMLGALGLALTLTTPAVAEIAADPVPTPPSENSVDIIVAGDECGDSLSFPVQCSSGLTAVHFNAFPLVANVGDTFGLFSENLCLPGFPSPEGINCEVVEEDIGGEEVLTSVRWSLGPPPVCEDDDFCPPEPAVRPEAIRSVILSRCGGFGGGGISYNYLYGPLGVSADQELRLFLPELVDDDNGGAVVFEQRRPFDVTFCFGDPDAQPDDPALASVPPIPPCGPSAACPGGSSGDETSLVEFFELRDDAGDIKQPEQALNDNTCVCGPVEDIFVGLEGCNPAIGEGAPNACRGGFGPGQVTLIDQLNGDPYFCRTFNGVRRCWAY